MSPEDVEAIQAKHAVDESDVRALLARVPPSWRMGRPWGGEDGAYFLRGGLQVICSLSRESDGHLWVHASVCGRTGPTKFFLPSWEDLKRVKNDFCGEDAWAYQVLPAKKDYVNQHPYVLHLFARFDGQPALPDFTHGLGTI